MPREITRQLHDGVHERPGCIPYARRNFMADFDGCGGGWLMSDGDSFVEQVDAFRTWIAGGGGDDDEGEE